MNHNAIYALYPTVVTVDDTDGARDAQGIKVEIRQRALWRFRFRLPFPSPTAPAQSATQRIVGTATLPQQQSLWWIAHSPQPTAM